MIIAADGVEGAQKPSKYQKQKKTKS